jgi:nicotinamidase-related amidase
MPLTILDERPALVVIDLQKALLQIPSQPYAMVEIVSRTASLAQSFRNHGLQVVLVTVNGSAPGRTEMGPRNISLPADGAQIVSELGPAPQDFLVTRQHPGAFIGTSLDAFLKEKGISQIVLAGVSTSNGVEATARSALDLGYNIVFVLDAMADRDATMHRHCIERVFPRLGETASTEDVLKRIEERPM